MNIRIPLTTVVLFFLIQPIQAQDTLKHVTKRSHKTHVSDTNKIAHSNHASHVKDTAQIRREHILKALIFPRDGYVAIVGGVGLPLAAYSSDEGAATGSAFSVSAAFPGIISHAGIAFKFDYGINALNQARVQGIANNNAGFSNINCTVPASTLGHCTYSAFLGGLYLTYPKKHITIDFRMLAGVMFAQIPAVTVNYYEVDNENTASYNSSGASGSAFAINFGFEIRYPVKPRITILLSGDYLHAVPSFPVVRTGATLTSYGTIMPDNGDGQFATASQPFSIFSLSVGVGYTISAKKRYSDSITPSYK